MLAVERRLKLLERIAEDQAIEVSSLARDFLVSEMTIRRDLSRLERDGFVRRTYGGATTHVVRAFEVGTNARVLHHAQEKHQIARRTTELTSGARVMFVGIGSTVEQFARLLPPRGDLVVVTPSLAVASLLGTRKVRVIVRPGLSLQPNTRDRVNLARLYAAGFNGRPDGSSAQLSSSDGGQGALERANGSALGRNDDDIMV